MKVFDCFVFLVCLAICSAQECDDGIERPCDTSDMDCIDDVIVQELQCTPVEGKRKNSHIIKSLTLYYPHANSTIKYRNAKAIGFNDYTVNNFYVDRQNKLLVLEVTLTNLEVRCDDSTVTFFKKGRNPVITYGGTDIAYRNMSLTLTVFNVDGSSKHDLRDYEVYAYISDINPPAGYSKSVVPNDAQSLQQLYGIVGKWPLSLRSKQITQGPLLMNYLLPCNLNLNTFY